MRNCTNLMATITLSFLFGCFWPKPDLLNDRFAEPLKTAMGRLQPLVCGIAESASSLNRPFIFV